MTDQDDAAIILRNILAEPIPSSRILFRAYIQNEKISVCCNVIKQDTNHNITIVQEHPPNDWTARQEAKARVWTKVWSKEYCEYDVKR